MDLGPHFDHLSLREQARDTSVSTRRRVQSPVSLPFASSCCETRPRRRDKGKQQPQTPQYPGRQQIHNVSLFNDPDISLSVLGGYFQLKTSLDSHASTRLNYDFRTVGGYLDPSSMAVQAHYRPILYPLPGFSPTSISIHIYNKPKNPRHSVSLTLAAGTKSREFLRYITPNAMDKDL
jgi:hypothetical protein